jgi:DNA-binding MarR family transcriptional regulator
MTPPPPTSRPRSSTDLDPLMQASRTITAAVVRSLAAVEAAISVTQLRVLVMVGAQGPLTVGAVAAALDVNASNASRTCERLVRAGLLHRREAEHDRRQVALTLTTQGRALVERVMERRRQQLAAVVDGMPAEDREALMRALEAFNAAAEKVHPGSEGGDEHLIAWMS